MQEMNVFSRVHVSVPLNAAGDVQNASVHRRGRRSEDADGRQLQASPAYQREESAFLQLI